MNKLLFAFLALAIMTSGCLDFMEDNELPSEFENADVQVLVGEMYFQQEGLEENLIEAEVGDEIVFYNEGAIRHTVTIPVLDLDEEVDTEGTVSVTVDEELESALIDCTFHDSHDAVLTVES